MSLKTLHYCSLYPRCGQHNNFSETHHPSPLLAGERGKEILSKCNLSILVSYTPRFLHHPEELFIKNDIFAVKDQKGNFNLPPEDLELGSKNQSDDFPLLKPPPPYSLVVTPATPRTPTSPLPSDLQLVYFDHHHSYYAYFIDFITRNNNPAGLIPTPSIQEQSQDDSKQK